MRSSVRARSGCLKSLARLIRCAVLRELRERRRVLLELRERALERSRERIAQLEAVARELDGRRDQILPRLAAERLPREVKTRRPCPGTPTARWLL